MAEEKNEKNEGIEKEKQFIGKFKGLSAPMMKGTEVKHEEIDVTVTIQENKTSKEVK